MKILKLVLDCSVLDRYYDYYFKKYPKRSKKPITHPYHESINKWFIMMRPQMNALKQSWKDFWVWWIKDLGLENSKFENFTLTSTVFMPTRRRCDPDNTVIKFFLDGMVEGGLIIDDDGKHLKALTLKTDYDKDNPRTELDFVILDDEKENENE